MTDYEACHGLKGALCLMLCLLLGPAAPALAALPKAHEVRLGNGLRVVLSEQRSLPLISVALIVADGSRSDPQGKAGLASLTSALLQEGTRTRSAEELARAIDFLGASLDATTDFDLTVVSMNMLAKDLDAGLKIFCEVVLEPSFPTAEVKRKRQEMIGAIEADKQDPGKVAERAFLGALYGPGAPYGHPPEGTTEGLSAATRQDIARHYKQFYLPNNCILVAVGDFSSQEFVAHLKAAFGGWEKGEPPQLAAPSPAPPKKPLVLVDEPIVQANVAMGRHAIERSDPDYYALQVGNYILGGGGFASRLVEQVRARRGLAYSVHSELNARAWPGSFEVVMQTANATAQEAIDLVKKQVALMAEKQVSAKELKAAKQYLVGSFPLKLDSNAKLARYLAAVTFYGLGLDYAERYPKLIEVQTPKKILEAWRRKIASHEPTIVVVANQAETGLKEK